MSARLVAARVGSGVGRLLARRTPATARSMSGQTDVKRRPDLERWNNVRDNVDQLYDISNPKTAMTTFIWAFVFPYLIYTAIDAEGPIKNGDDSTGCKFGPQSDTYTKPQTFD